MKIMIQAECEDWDNWKKVYDDFAHIREGFSKDILSDTKLKILII